MNKNDLVTVNEFAKIVNLSEGWFRKIVAKHRSKFPDPKVPNAYVNKRRTPALYDVTELHEFFNKVRI